MTDPDVRATVALQGRGDSRARFSTEREGESEGDFKNTSSRNDALARGRANETSSTAAIREVHPLDALTAAVCSLRPEWRPEHLRAVIARDRRPWRDVVAAALHAALDPDVRHPAAIENHDTRAYGPSEALRHPSAVSFADRQRELRALDGDGAA